MTKPMTSEEAMSAQTAREAAEDCEQGLQGLLAGDELAATLRDYAAMKERQTVTANCCECGRIVDTREECDGGDRHGCQLSDKRWVCSQDCWDKNVDDACRTVNPGPEVSGLVEALETLLVASENVLVDSNWNDIEEVRDPFYAAQEAARQALATFKGET